MTFKESIDNFLRKNTPIIFYSTLLLVAITSIGKGTVPIILWEAPPLIPVVCLVFSTYCFYLLEKDYKELMREYEKLASRPEPVQRKVVQPAPEADYQEDDFDNIMEEFK